VLVKWSFSRRPGDYVRLIIGDGPGINAAGAELTPKYILVSQLFESWFSRLGFQRNHPNGPVAAARVRIIQDPFSPFTKPIRRHYLTEQFWTASHQVPCLFFFYTEPVPDPFVRNNCILIVAGHHPYCRDFVEIVFRDPHGRYLLQLLMYPACSSSRLKRCRHGDGDKPTFSAHWTLLTAHQPEARLRSAIDRSNFSIAGGISLV
jgi:hypothetical protein